MKSEYQIFCDYQRAVNKSNTLLKIASYMDEIAQEKIDNQMCAISRYWSGEAQDLYKQKLGVAAQDVSVSAGKLREVANTILTIAKVNYKAELKALEAIRTKNVK